MANTVVFGGKQGVFFWENMLVFKANTVILREYTVVSEFNTMDFLANTVVF